jgi:hypothetical protein
MAYFPIYIIVDMKGAFCGVIDNRLCKCVKNLLSCTHLVFKRLITNPWLVVEEELFPLLCVNEFELTLRASQSPGFFFEIECYDMLNKR